MSYVLIITTLLASSTAESLFADGVFDQVGAECSDARCRILCFRQLQWPKVCEKAE